MDDWDRASELLQTHRAQVGHIWQATLTLTLGMITVAGFALDRESWGLAALAIVPELAIVLIGERFRRAAAHLLETAAALERSAAGNSAVADAHFAAVLERGSSSSERARRVAALGISVHVVLVVLLALVFDWTFVGG